MIIVQLQKSSSNTNYIYNMLNPVHYKWDMLYIKQPFMYTWGADIYGMNSNYVVHIHN